MLCPQELTYKLTTLGLKNILAFNILGSYLWYTISKLMLYAPSFNVILNDTFQMVYLVTQTNVICKSDAPKKLMYQHTTFRLTELLAFNILGSF